MQQLRKDLEIEKSILEVKKIYYLKIKIILLNLMKKLKEEKNKIIK